MAADAAAAPGDPGDGGNYAGASPRVFLSWRDVSVSVKRSSGASVPAALRSSSSSSSSAAGTRYLLRDVSGYAEPGGLVAIMGPSGSGKSTLLHTLAGRSSGSHTMARGQILVNGTRQQLSYGNSAYVTQDDSLIPTLTVYETIMYSAHLQLSESMDKRERHERVEQTIKDMGLQDCAHTKIGGWYVRGLSGGEKRRVSIAIETLKKPHLMFLDEPTSGLDSAAAYHVVRRLKVMTQAGDRTIIASIHQPNSEVFGLFSHLCLLSIGKVVYFGESHGAQQFFESVGFPCPAFRNPSDHYLWVINSEFEEVQEHDSNDIENIKMMNTLDKVEMIVNSYHQSDIRKSVLLKIEECSKKGGAQLKSFNKKSNFLRESFWLTSRSFTNMSRDLSYYWFRLFVYILLSFVVGTIYYKVGLSYSAIQARASMFTFVTSFLSFLGVLSFPSFIEDMKIFTRERLNGHYGVGPFVVANTLSSFPFVTLISLIPGTIVYTMGGLHPGFDHFACFFLTLLACLSLVEGMLMAIASVVPDFLIGMIAGCGLMAVYLLNGGFFRLLNDLPKPVWRYPLSYLSFHSWANRAFYNNDFVGLQFESNVRGQPALEGTEIVREMFQMHISYSKWWATFVLACMSVLYRLFFVAGIKMRERAPAFIHSLDNMKDALGRLCVHRFISPAHHNLSDDDHDRL